MAVSAEQFIVLVLSISCGVLGGSSSRTGASG